MLCQRLVVRPVITDPVTVTLPITDSHQGARNPQVFVVPVTVSVGCLHRFDSHGACQRGKSVVDATQDRDYSWKKKGGAKEADAAQKGGVEAVRDRVVRSAPGRTGGRISVAVPAASTLRSWEQRVYVPPARNKGRRNKGRHRLYTEADPIPLRPGGRRVVAEAQKAARLRSRTVGRLPTRAVGPLRAG